MKIGDKKSVLDYVFGNEAWSVCLICLTQDLPFFIIRFYVLVKYSNEFQNNYTTYFFLIKSFVLLVLEIYRVATLIIQEIHLNKITLTNTDEPEGTEV